MVGRSGADGRSWRSRSSPLTAYGFSRVPTGFLPIEDQGYLIALVQLPDGASLERTQKTLDQVVRDRPQDTRASIRSSPSPACRRSTTARRSPMPASPTSSSRTGASAARARTLLSLFKNLNAALADDRGGEHPGDAAAADPGRRQRRRLHHADRVARRQLRPRQAAERHQRDRGQCQVAVGIAAWCWRRSAPTFRNIASRSTA